LGLRLRNVDLTKTFFDEIPAVGLERKVREGPMPGVLTVGLLKPLPRDAPALEQEHSGIRMARDDRTVAFIREGDSQTRQRIRLAETAKYLKVAYAGNGDVERAQHYHVVERRQRRKAMRGSRPGLRLRRPDLALWHKHGAPGPCPGDDRAAGLGDYFRRSGDRGRHRPASGQG
jgi:hypothetical protein